MRKKKFLSIFSQLNHNENQMFRKFLPSLLALTLALYPLHATDYPTQSASENEVVFPNPASLKPTWWKSFDGDGVPHALSAETIESVDETLTTLAYQLEDEDERQSALRVIQQIHANMESLLTIRKQAVSRPVIAWIPKAKYTLSEYIALSDQVKNLDSEIALGKRELKKQQAFFNNFKKSQISAFNDYIALDAPPNVKYVQGLQIMSKRFRLAYLEDEIRLSKEFIKSQQRQLERLGNEREQVAERLDLASLNPQELTELRRKSKVSRLQEHDRLLALEAQSIQSGQAGQAGTLINTLNQKVTLSLAKEALYGAQEIYCDLALLFQEMVTAPIASKKYREQVKHLGAVAETFTEQAELWRAIANDEMDDSSKALLLERDSRSKSAGVIQERNRIALDTMVVLDNLVQEIYHINLIEGIAMKVHSKDESFFDTFKFYASKAIDGIRAHGVSWMKHTLFEIGDTPINLGSITKACLVLFFTFWVSRFLRRGLVKIARTKNRDSESEASIYTFSRLLHYGILLVGVLFALVSIGVTLSSLALIIGALGIGIGFGLQNMVNNFLCGLVILFERNVKVGDLIEIEAGLSGKIAEVNVQNTTIHTADGTDIIVPNSTIIGSRLTNWTKDDPYQRLHIPFSTSLDSDQDFVKKVISKAALDGTKAIKESHIPAKPDVWLVRIGECSLDFELVVWVTLAGCYGRQGIMASYVSVIEKTLKSNNISIPFPQRDLHIKSIADGVSLKPISGGKKGE